MEIVEQSRGVGRVCDRQPVQRSSVKVKGLDIDLADGDYAIDYDLSGNGTMKLVEPAKLTVKDGKAFARLAWNDPEVDKLIRAYGYSGTENVMKLWRTEPVLQDLTHGTAHLIHGSSEGRFRITYAPGHLTKEEVESVCFGYADLAETLKRYDPAKMKTGFNTMPDGEEVYYISTPSAGLWSTKEKIEACVQ